MSDVENLGASHPQEDHVCFFSNFKCFFKFCYPYYNKYLYFLQPPKSDDLAVICYTSGTTDAPKGVMLTHENIVANFSAILHHLVEYRLNATDTLISYLPLGHMFERVCEV